jgi:hypothetical protein
MFLSMVANLSVFPVHEKQLSLLVVPPKVFLELLDV